MRCALVTGASGGIGGAICDMLADKGFSLALAYNKNEQAAASLIAKYQKNGTNCIAVSADLCRDDGADRLADGLKGFSRVDTLINCAGVASFGQICDVTEEEIRRVMNVNFYSPLRLIRRLSQSMTQQGFGRIVNISSMWSLVGSSCESVYSASKAALEGLSKSLAKELGRSGITVNCVAPGLIDTEMNREIDRAAISEIVDNTPLNRMGTPSDVAKSVALLVDEDCFITGETLNVSGGFVII